MAKTLSEKKISSFIQEVENGNWRSQSIFLPMLKSLENSKNRTRFIEKGLLELMQQSLLDNPDTYNMFEEFSVIFFLTLQREGVSYAAESDVKWVRYGTLMLKRFMRPDTGSQFNSQENTKSVTTGRGIFSRAVQSAPQSKAPNTALDQVNEEILGQMDQEGSEDEAPPSPKLGALLRAPTGGKSMLERPIARAKKEIQIKAQADYYHPQQYLDLYSPLRPAPLRYGHTRNIPGVRIPSAMLEFQNKKDAVKKRDAFQPQPAQYGIQRIFQAAVQKKAQMARRVQNLRPINEQLFAQFFDKRGRLVLNEVTINILYIWLMILENIIKNEKGLRQMQADQELALHFLYFIENYFQQGGEPHQIYKQYRNFHPAEKTTELLLELLSDDEPNRELSSYPLVFEWISRIIKRYQQQPVVKNIYQVAATLASRGNIFVTEQECVILQEVVYPHLGATLCSVRWQSGLNPQAQQLRSLLKEQDMREDLIYLASSVLNSCPLYQPDMAPILIPIFQKHYVDWTWRILFHYLAVDIDLSKVYESLELLMNLMQSGIYLPPNYAQVMMIDGLKVSLEELDLILFSDFLALLRFVRLNDHLKIRLLQLILSYLNELNRFPFMTLSQNNLDRYLQKLYYNLKNLKPPSVLSIQENPQQAISSKAISPAPPVLAPFRQGDSLDQFLEEEKNRVSPPPLSKTPPPGSRNLRNFTKKGSIGEKMSNISEIDEVVSDQEGIVAPNLAKRGQQLTQAEFQALQKGLREENSINEKEGKKKGGKKFGKGKQAQRLDSRESQDQIGLKHGSASHFYFYNLVYGLSALYSTQSFLFTINAENTESVREWNQFLQFDLMQSRAFKKSAVMKIIHEQRARAQEVIKQEISLPASKKNYKFLWRDCEICSLLEKDHERFLSEVDKLKIKKQKEEDAKRGDQDPYLQTLMSRSTRRTPTTRGKSQGGPPAPPLKSLAALNNILHVGDGSLEPKELTDYENTMIALFKSLTFQF